MTAIIDYRGKTPRKTLTGIPLITAKVVKGGRIETPDEFIAIEDYEPWMRRGFPKVGDVVITTEAPLGEVAQLHSERIALAQRLIALRGKDGVIDNTFLKFLMQSADVQNQLRARASGTTVLGIKQSELRRVMLTLPSIDEQRAIATILGALDDKIELNRRMNGTLEAMARAIFKSWFIDFDPVRAKAAGADPKLPKPIADLFPDSFQQSELGEIPKGWSVADIYSLSEVIYGAPFKSALFTEARIGLPLIRIRDLATHDPDVFTAEEHPKGYRVRGGDLVVGMDGEFRAHLWRGPDAWLNQRLCCFKPKSDIPRAFVHYSIESLLAFFERAKTGTTVIHLGKSDIDTFRVAVPTPSVLTAFGRLVDPLDARVIVSSAQERTLAALRDALLPKLISGEIRIKDAERIVGRAV